MMNRKTRILLVDDDVFTIRFFKTLYHDRSYIIRSINTGKDVVEAIKNSHFELVLLNLGLADISGLDMLKEINRMENSPEVIIISGYSTLESAIEAMKLGAFDYVQKPFENIEEIRVLIDKALEKKYIRDENEFLKRKIRDILLGDKNTLRKSTISSTYFEMPYRKSKEVFEKEYIIHALRVHQGNILKASRKTKIPRQNFYLKIKKYGINPDLFRSN